MKKRVHSDTFLITETRRAVSAELCKKRVLNKPIAEFNPKDKKVYLVYSDGERRIVGEAMQKGRYSERCK